MSSIITEPFGACAGALKLNLDCHLPGPIAASVIYLCTIDAPNASVTTLLLVLAEIVTGCP